MPSQSESSLHPVFRNKEKKETKGDKTSLQVNLNSLLCADSSINKCEAFFSMNMRERSNCNLHIFYYVFIF